MCAEAQYEHQTPVPAESQVLNRYRANEERLMRAAGSPKRQKL